MLTPTLRLKRFLIFLLECFVILLGTALGLALGAGLLSELQSRDVFIAIACAVTVALTSLILIRAKTAAFRLRYDAAHFLSARQSTIGHPHRSKFFRRAKSILICLPALWAATVLFFFPQVSHIFHVRQNDSGLVVHLWSCLPSIAELRHSGADQLLHNQIRTPWNWTIVSTYERPSDYSIAHLLIDHRAPWPFGTKFVPHRDARLSAVTLGSLSRDEVLRRRVYESNWPKNDEAERTSRSIHADGIDLTCSGYSSPSHVGFWNIHCETSSPLQARNLDTRFTGPAGDLPAFYEVLQTAKPAN